MDQTLNQNSSNKILYSVGAIIVIALVAWYLTSKQPVTSPKTTVDEQASTPSLTSGDTTVDIMMELNMTPDNSATIDQDAAATASAIQGL